MQSSAPRFATDLENLTPSRFNSKSSVTDSDHVGVKSPGIASPALKKLKPAVAVVSYPETVDIPSKSLIRALYESAVSQKGSHQNQLDEIGCGLLSLEGGGVAVGPLVDVVVVIFDLEPDFCSCLCGLGSSSMYRLSWKNIL